MKKLLFLCFALITSTLSAQIVYDQSLANVSLVPGQSQIKFIVVENVGTFAEELELHIPAVYGSYYPFSTDTSLMLLNPGEKDSFRIEMKSEHNLDFTSYVFIERTNKEALPVKINAQLRYANSYYSSSYNMREEALKTSLRNKISGQTSVGYNSARDAIFLTLDNKKYNGQGASVNTLECVYTGREAIAYVNRQDAQSGSSFNTEHTFPQGFFSSNEPMKSDIFHLYPTDALSNTQRSNLPFGLVANPTWTEGGSKKGGGKFEPRDEQKGVSARAMFYFLTRYGDYDNFFPQQEQILKTWNLQFLPNAVEKKRNDDIEVIQKNRNPFIDYPVFAERIHNFAGISENPNAVSYDFFPSRTILDTISVDSSRVVYLYNSGDSIIQIAGNSFSSVNGDFELTTQDSRVFPKEYALFVLSPKKSGVLEDSIALSISPSAAGMQYVYFKAFAEGIISSIRDIDPEDLIYFDGKALVCSEEIEITRVTDANGREVSIDNLRNEDFAKSLATGIYHVQYQLDSKLGSYKFFKP